MLESQIQSRIVKALEAAGWFVTKLITTSTPGIPDLLALRSGRHVWIEVKAAGGRVAHLQAFRHEQLRRFGGEVIVAYGVEDVKELMIKKQ